MKRTELLRVIARRARAAGLDWKLVRQGSSHELWELDGERVTVPRHNELRERLAGSILKSLENKLGKGWWRR